MKTVAVTQAICRCISSVSDGRKDKSVPRPVRTAGNAWAIFSVSNGRKDKLVTRHVLTAGNALVTISNYNVDHSDVSRYVSDCTVSVSPR